MADHPTIAEELGFAPDAKLLIINADDSGLCHSANMATLRALEMGAITTTTAMPPCPWFAEMASIAAANPELDVGLHLTVNCEWRRYRWAPVAGARAVPSLVGPEGFFWASEEETVAYGTVEDVKTEVRAQIERALALGMLPTHIDNHMGPLHYRQDFFEAMVEIGHEYGLPARVPFYHEVAAAHDMPCIQSFGMYYSPEGGKAAKFELYEAHLANLAPGVHEIAVHLADDTDEWRELCYVAVDDHPWEDRIFDYEYVTAPSTQQRLEELGIQLLGYRALQDLWKKRLAAK
ncbi:MAG: polysaccharide deacetylase family protein [bacterium]